MPRIAAVIVSLFALGCHETGPAKPAITDVQPTFAVIGTTSTITITGNFDGFAGATVHVSVARTHDLFGNPVGDPLQEIASGTLGPAPIRGLYLEVLPQDPAPAGLYSLHLTAAGNEVSMSDALALLPAPAVRALDRSVLCLADSPSPLRILGTAIPILGTALPSVQIATPAGAFPSFAAQPAVTMASCREVVFSRAQIALCEGIDLQVPADAPKGDLVVKANVGGLGLPPLPFSAPLLVDRFADFQMRGPYATADGEAAILWQGAFHRGAASPPSASVDGSPAAPVFGECTESSVSGEFWCKSVSIPLPHGAPAGLHSYTFSSMTGCTSAGSAQVLDPPQVASMEPAVICAASRSDHLVIHGSGFYDPRVFVGDLEAVPALVCPPASSPPASTCDTLAIYSLPRCVLGICPSYQPGQYTLWVENGTTPPIRRPLATPVTVEPGPPLVSAPSPSKVYNGVDRQVFLRVDNQTGSLVSAEFQPWGGIGTSVPAKAIAPAPGGALITVQAGLAPQWWQIVVHDESASCPAVSQSEPLIPQAEFVTWSDDFEGAQDPLYVYFDSGTPAFAATDPGPGNGGGKAAHYSAGPGGPGWFFSLPLGSRNDLATARFDFRRAGTGNAASQADVSVVERLFRLDAALTPAPVDAWTHYDVPLGDPGPWTYRGQDGTTRPATAADLRTALDDGATLRIRGSAYDGSTDASLDNVSIELAH